MSKIRVRTYGEKVLREKAKDVKTFDAELAAFLDDMVETMMYEDGVGLAANQVGVAKRIAVVNPVPGDPDSLLKLVNPKITARGDNTVGMEEGCLSVPGIRGNVVRPSSLTLAYMDEKGAQHTLEAEGLLARVIQHELDHLAGILFVDRLSFGKKTLIRGKLRDLAGTSRSENGDG